MGKTSDICGFAEVRLWQCCLKDMKLREIARCLDISWSEIVKARGLH